MNIYILFTLCFLPVIALFAIFSIVTKDHPVFRYAISCAFGIATVAPASFIQFLTLKIPTFSSPSFFSILITAILFNGFIEESFKLAFILLIPKKRMTLQSFLCASILLGCASGSLETAIYLMNSLQKIALIPGTEHALRMIFTRMFSAQAIHAFCAGLSGIFIWSCQKEIHHLIIVIIAITMHGLYNFFIAFSQEFRWFAMIAILLAAIECRIWYKTVKNEEISQNSQKLLDITN